MKSLRQIGDLGEEGLAEVLQDLRQLAPAPLLEALVWRLAEKMGGEDFPDDVSGVLFEYRGAG